MRVFKLAVVLVVAYFLYRAIIDARQQLAEQEFDASTIRPSWLFAAAAIYLAGMFPMGVYWHRILQAMGQSPIFFDTLRAYYTGHLGKYVPGKAMVVVIRTGLLGGANANSTVVAISVFAETLAMMAVGAFLAALLIAVRYSEQQMFLWASIGLMLVAGIPTWPPVFRWLVRKFKIKSASTDIQTALDGYTWRIFGLGWLMNLIGWCFLGLSLCAVLQAVSVESIFSQLSKVFPTALASTSLATVAGFLSLLPGGILVRELVIEELLAPEFGKGLAIIAAVLLRLTWLFGELMIAIVFYLLNQLRVSRSMASS